MSDYYHQFLTSMSGVGADHSPQEGPPTSQQHGSVPMGATQMPNAYQSLGYFTGFPEPIMFSAPKAQRSRRKSAPGLDHIKHRRTRSGCYTCRSRRVKCDERHPICERCRKGKRDCVYPDPPTSKQTGGLAGRDGTSSSQHTSPDSSHGEEDEDMDPDTKLDTILDEDEPEPLITPLKTARSMPIPRRSSATASLQRIVTRPRQGSETPSIEGSKSSSPATSTGTTGSLTPAAYQFPESSLLTAGAGADWGHLPQDMRFYLNYYCENITHYHYCIGRDPDDFFRTILPRIAARNEALLYALVGFAAYHHTLRDPNGKVHQFLRYYNQSVTVLLGFLQRKEKHNISTLLTILQLATIEEYLGDWVNLMGHQKAALEVLTQLFTPQTAMQTSTGRMILSWYARYDVFVGLMGGFETSLPQEWFSVVIDYCQAQVAQEPNNVGWKLDESSARLRLISREMSVLVGRGAKGELTGDAFASEHVRISKALRAWKDSWHLSMTNAAYLVKDFGHRRPLNPNNIVDPFQPGILYEHPIFQTTILTCDWHSIVVMHAQSAMSARDEPPPDIVAHAYAICQIFEAVELWPSSPPGCLITIQASLLISALFLPRDERHHMWMRRKFALLESMGYVFSLAMRTRMAALFRDQSCIRWWLPDDEGFSPILQSIRTFADERNTVAVTAQMENLREVRHIFSKMQLGRGEEAQPEDLDYGGAFSMSKGKGATR